MRIPLLSRGIRQCRRENNETWYWVFPRSLTDEEIKDYFRSTRIDPIGQRYETVSAFGGTRVVYSPITIRRRGSRTLVKQEAGEIL